ncbi:MAG: fused MFS/spermidine synthase [bacterium]|nr:fused MFS/spermidine synthase [bacterium]
MVEKPAEQSPASGILPLLLVLFIGSGCSGLIYEIVWFQMLQLAIGSSAISLGVLLGTFMGGMCLGSLLLPRVITARHHPLQVYALLELGIGILGFLLLFAVPAVGGLYSSIVRPGLPSVILRGVACVICLLPPTLLMGATLPAIARWTKTTPKGVSWLGFFYGGNIAGAVFGCLLAGFYLLRVYDSATATFVAVAINVTVAVVGLLLSRKAPYQVPEDVSDQNQVRVSDSRVVYWVIGFSGMAALGAQAIWTRLLSLMLGATVYTFSIILAVFLMGLGIGSSFGATMASSRSRPRMALGWCQWLVTISIAWTAYMLSVSLPYWPVEPAFVKTPWINFQFDLVRCLWAIFPATVLWGASFPLALAAIGASEKDPGHLVGRVYAANTAGAIVGAFGFSVLMVAWLGTQVAQQVLILLALFGSLLMFASVFLRRKSTVSRKQDLAWLTGLTAIGILLAWGVPEVPRGLIAYGRNLPSWGDSVDYIYVREGMNASIAVSEHPGGDREFHVSGKVVASNEAQDMRLQRMLGHIPALIHSGPKSVLVVGCGAGITAGTFVLHPNMERIVICEIEPVIPPAAATYFGKENYHVMEDFRVEIVYDDARHYIVTTQEKFDIITSDPIHPWVKGAASLYSKEYFELVKQHLNPGGVVTQWVPLYETHEKVVKSEFATFMEVFPNGTVWGNEVKGGGYDVVLLGQVGPTTVDVDALFDRLNREDHTPVLQSLREIGLGSVMALLGTYSGRGLDMVHWLEDAEINRDRNLRLQYLAGMGLNMYQEEDIYASILEYYVYPKDLFLHGTARRERALKRRLERGGELRLKGETER